MHTHTEARSLILTSLTPLGSERVDLLSALGRIIAEDIVAPWNMPLCENSAMDGFAVRSGDCAERTTLVVTNFVPAGETSKLPVEQGCAIRIMTGAPLPAGADAVVPIEETEPGDGTVTINGPVPPRQYIRMIGEDVAAGELAIPSGTLIRPPEVSLLASFGRAQVPVFRRPVVAIVSTGDELVDLGVTPTPGLVVNSNVWSLAAAVRECGAEPRILGIARDTRESHLAMFREGLRADALITSAGVSAGDRDLVRDVLAELGAEQLFWKVAMKPGGPTAFALYRGKPVFSLPGNPVSTMVTFEEFVRPALLKMMGHRRVIKPLVKAVLKDGVSKKPGKLHFLRVKLSSENGRYVVFSSGEQNTGILKTMLMADAMALLPADRATFSPGEEVDVRILSGNAEMLEK